MKRLEIFFFWLLVLIIISSYNSAYGQIDNTKFIGDFGPIKIAVGEDTTVYTFSDPEGYSEQTYVCYCRFIYCFPFKSDVSDYNHRADQPFGPTVILSPRHLCLNPRTDNIFAQYETQGVKYDGKSCDAHDIYGTNRAINISWSSYWDSIVKIRPLKNTIIFTVDKSTHQYLAQGANYDFYNNIDDTVSYSDWNIITNPPLSLALTFRRKDTIVNSILSPPFEHQISLYSIFNTMESTRRFERQYDGFIRTRVKTSSYDSIMINPITIILQADPTSDVPLNAITITDKLEISPNPSSGYLKALVSVAGNSDADLSIYDILGHKLRTISNGILSGDHEYNITLPSGSYYLRLQTSGGVITRRVIVE